MVRIDLDGTIKDVRVVGKDKYNELIYEYDVETKGMKFKLRTKRLFDTEKRVHAFGTVYNNVIYANDVFQIACDFSKDEKV